MSMIGALLQSLGIDLVQIAFWVAILLTLITVLLVVTGLPFKLLMGFLSLSAWGFFGMARVFFGLKSFLLSLWSPVPAMLVAFGITFLIVTYATSPKKKTGMRT